MTEGSDYPLNALSVVVPGMNVLYILLTNPYRSLEG